MFSKFRKESTVIGSGEIKTVESRKPTRSVQRLVEFVLTRRFERRPMSEEAKALKQSIGKVEPQVLGKMFREYFKSANNIPPVLVKALSQETTTAEYMKVFDGGLL